MKTSEKPTFGLAFSGGGNSSCFYIGFLEVLQENNIKPDYIAACSGGSLVAAAYACGTLQEFKQTVLALNQKSVRNYFRRNEDGGGLYSMDFIEDELRKFTKNLNFEDVRPLMGFVAVDLENGEKVVMGMGDIARAARISCTLPAVFRPVKWGGKTLVDGGLLSFVPGDVLRQANMDITVGINMRKNKYIFAKKLIKGKKVLNFFKKILFIREINMFLDSFNILGEIDLEKTPGIFSILGRSMDLAIAANKMDLDKNEACDLNIKPETPSMKTWAFSSNTLQSDCECGRITAKKYLPEILKLLERK